MALNLGKWSKEVTCRELPKRIEGVLVCERGYVALLEIFI